MDRDLPWMMCATCRRPLDAVRDLDGDRQVGVRYRHSDHDLPEDHPPAPIPRQGGGTVSICDFCCGPGCDWAYPCEDFPRARGLELVDGQLIPTTSWSRGGWGACDACHADIEAGHWEQLAARAALHYPARARADFKGDVLELWALFRAHRSGPAIHDYGMSDI